jgi:hypothetical protein
MKQLKQIQAAFYRLPPRPAAVARAIISLGLGLVTAVLFSYLFYRFGLPSKPFIYVSF